MKTTKKIHTKNFSSDFEGKAISRIRPYDPQNLVFNEPTDREMLDYHKIYITCDKSIDINGIKLSPVLAIHDISAILKKHFMHNIDDSNILEGDYRIEIKIAELKKEMLFEIEECDFFIVPCEYNKCLGAYDKKEVHWVIRNPEIKDVELFFILCNKHNRGVTASDIINELSLLHQKKVKIKISINYR